MRNTFWREVVESWADYVCEPAEASDFLSQPLWNNVSIKVDNKLVYYKSWYSKNLRHIDDLVDESGVFLSPQDRIIQDNDKCFFTEAKKSGVVSITFQSEIWV